MLGMIILCLEKVNILFNQPDTEWVATSIQFLETGIQGVQKEVSAFLTWAADPFHR